jgi:hypothetical protein
MSNEGSARGCAFCGKSGVTLYKEHCFPDWLRKEYGKGQMRHALETVEGRKEWESAPFQFQTRCTCHSCQHGWMARLEERAKPFLRSMIEGYGRTLYDEGREAVATWATKTAMAFEGTDPYKSIPKKHWRHIAANHSPPRNTQVWLGALDGPSVTTAVAYHWHNGLEAEGTNLYVATLSVGHMAVVVVGIGAEDPMARELAGWPSEALIEVWPASTPINWPPALIMDVERLRILGSTEFAMGSGG